MKNIGSVKDYRSARQLILDAESAMLKSMDTERWRMRTALDRADRDVRDAHAARDRMSHMVDQALREKEVCVATGCLSRSHDPAPLPPHTLPPRPLRSQFAPAPNPFVLIHEQTSLTTPSPTRPRTFLPMYPSH